MTLYSINTNKEHVNTGLHSLKKKINLIKVTTTNNNNKIITENNKINEAKPKKRILSYDFKV